MWHCVYLRVSHRKSLADFAVASRMQPNNADTLYSKGETEINLGLFKEAFLTLRQGLQLKPQVVLCKL